MNVGLALAHERNRPCMWRSPKGMRINRKQGWKMEGRKKKEKLHTREMFWERSHWMSVHQVEFFRFVSPFWGLECHMVTEVLRTLWVIPQRTETVTQEWSMDRPRAIRMFEQSGQGSWGLLYRDQVLYLLPGSGASAPPAWSPHPFERFTFPVSRICKGPVQSEWEKRDWGFWWSYPSLISNLHLYIPVPESSLWFDLLIFITWLKQQLGRGTSQPLSPSVSLMQSFYL